MIRIKNKNLLCADEQYLAHICNYEYEEAQGITKTVFDRYSYADIYWCKERIDFTKIVDILGDGGDRRFIINIYVNNTTQNDINHLEKAIEKIKTIKGIKSVAFPYKEGFSDWRSAKSIISKLSDSGVKVSCYRNT